MSYLRNINVRWGCFDLTDVLKMRFKDDEVERYMIEKGDLVLCEGGEPGRCAIWDKANPIMFQKALHRIRCHGGVLNEYLKYVIEDYAKANKLEEYYTGSTIKHLTGESLVSILFPLPPIKEQERIVQEIQRYLSLVAIIENNKENLLAAIKQAKSKVLDLAIHGKLVPQDPNDEPAIELLKRINPKAEIITDNGHYQKLPSGWVICRLADIVSYEQPTPYIVKSTNYADSYETPVLTAGKSFIIGYTDETAGIYTSLPCIIFDDFTTDSKFVDFPFKVKSSAMKILQVVENINIEYVSMFMSITRLIGDTHKRYWISEYSKLEIPIPPAEEQKRIVDIVRLIFKKLDSISDSL